MKPALVVLLALCACANPKPEAVPPRETTVRAQPPLRVTWQEVSRSGKEAVVLARVERLLGIAMPFTMSVELPAGVTAREGRTTLTLVPNPEAVEVTEKFVLVYDALPQGDAVLKLDGDSGAMGFHYKVPYRFGRPEPVAQPPAVTGPPVVRGDKNFGPSVPLQ